MSVILATTAAALALPVQSTPPQQQQTARPSAEERPAPPRGEEIVVTGDRSDVIALPDRLSFSVANDLNVQNGTLADALRAAPGVDVDMEGRVSLRGDPGVTIMVDGRPSTALNGESRGDALQSMSAGQIERVEIITNPSAAMSPEGSGGVINLVTKRVREGARYGVINAAAGQRGRRNATANGALSGRKLTLTGDVSYRRFRGDANATMERERSDPATGTIVRTRQVTDDQTSMQMHSGRLGAEYVISPKSRLTGDLSYRGGNQGTGPLVRSVSDLPAATFDRTARTNISLRSLGARTSWRRTLPGRGHELAVDLDVDGTRQRRRIDGFTDFASAQDSFEQIATDVERTRIHGRIDYKRPLGNDGSLNLGYDGDTAKSGFDFRAARGPSLDALAPVPSLINLFDFNQAVHAVYGTYQADLGKWGAQFGLRAEQVVLDIDQRTDAVRIRRDYFRVYPTMHADYELTAAEQLRASYSRRIQRPSAQDLNPYTIYNDPLNLRRGNPFLRPEVTDSFEVSWQRRKGGNFYSLSAYFRTSRDGVTDVVQDIGGNVFLNTRANLATSERVGMEAVVSGRLTKNLTYNASGGFLWNQIDPRQAGVSQRRSGTTGTARASLTWQPSAKDLVQLNGNFSGPQLIAQGYYKSVGQVTVGYRRKIDERFSLTFTGQNILDTMRKVTVIDTPLLRDRIRERGAGPVLHFGLTLNLGSQAGRKRPEPAFDFD